MSAATGPEQGTAAELAAEIVDAVAEREAVGPLEIPPLYESIDAEALAALFDAPGDGIDHVTFTYYEYEVTVRGPGDVRVTPLEDG